MKFENIKSDGMKNEYKITFSAEEIERAIEEEVGHQAKTFKMQGFRTGHVPLNIVRNSIETKVLKDVLEALISNAAKDIAIQTNTSDFSSRPIYKIEDTYEKGKDILVTLTVEAAPIFELKPFDFDLKKIVPNITLEEIDDKKQELLKFTPRFEKADKDHLIKPKDQVFFKAVCFVNGVESSKKSFQDTVTLPEKIADDAEFLKGFIGKKVGEFFEFTPATEKNLMYKFFIKSIKHNVPFENVEDFVKYVKLENVEKFDEVVRNMITENINSKAFLYHKNQILEALGEQYKFDIPAGIAEQEMQSVIATVKKEMVDDKNAGKEVKEKTDEELKKEYAEVVEKRVILGYVLNKIAKQENIVATEEDLNYIISLEAQKNPEYAKQIFDYYLKTPGAIAYKKAEIIEEKVIKFLIEKSKITEEHKTLKEIIEIVNKLLEEE